MFWKVILVVDLRKKVGTGCAAKWYGSSGSATLLGLTGNYGLWKHPKESSIFCRSSNIFFYWNICIFNLSLLQSLPVPYFRLKFLPTWRLCLIFTCFQILVPFPPTVFFNLPYYLGWFSFDFTFRKFYFRSQHWF